LTLQDGQQLPLTHVPHLLKDAYVLKSLNQDLSVFWLNEYLDCQNSYPKTDYVDRIPLRVAPRDNLESSSYEKTATNSAINCQSKPSLQSSAIESKHNNFNFGAPQFPGIAYMQS